MIPQTDGDSVPASASATARVDRSRSPRRPLLRFSWSLAPPSAPLRRGRTPHPCSSARAGTAPPAVESTLPLSPAPVSQRPSSHKHAALPSVSLPGLMGRDASSHTGQVSHTGRESPAEAVTDTAGVTSVSVLAGRIDTTPARVWALRVCTRQLAVYLQARAQYGRAQTDDPCQEANIVEGAQVALRPSPPPAESSPGRAGQRPQAQGRQQHHRSHHGGTHGRTWRQGKEPKDAWQNGCGHANQSKKGRPANERTGAKTNFCQRHPSQLPWQARRRQCWAPAGGTGHRAKLAHGRTASRPDPKRLQPGKLNPNRARSSLRAGHGTVQHIAARARVVKESSRGEGADRDALGSGRRSGSEADAAEQSESEPSADRSVSDASSASGAGQPPPQQQHRAWNGRGGGGSPESQAGGWKSHGPRAAMDGTPTESY